MGLYMSKDDNDGQTEEQWMKINCPDKFEKEEQYVNPNPNKFIILNHESIGNYLIIEIKYIGCTNYKGKKVMVYENRTIEEMSMQKSIDPHFSENKDIKSPTARFEPTLKGWQMAVKLVRMLSGV